MPTAWFSWPWQSAAPMLVGNVSLMAAVAGVVAVHVLVIYIVRLPYSVSGGSIDNSPIGTTVPSTGAFVATPAAPFTVSGTGNAVINVGKTSIGGVVDLTGASSVLLPGATTLGSAALNGVLIGHGAASSTASTALTAASSGVFPQVLTSQAAGAGGGSGAAGTTDPAFDYLDGVYASYPAATASMAAGSLVSLLNGQLTLGFSEPPSLVWSSGNMRTSRVARLSDGVMVLAYVTTGLSTGVTSAYVQTVLNTNGTWTFVQPAVLVANTCNTMGALAITALDATHFAVACEDTQVGALNVTVGEVVSQAAPNIVSPLSDACLPLFNPLFYSVGAVTQSGFVVTGNGSNFPAAVVNGVLSYPDGRKATILGRYTGGTSLLVDTAYTVSSASAYEIAYNYAYSAVQQPLVSNGSNRSGAAVSLATQSGYTVTLSSGTNFATTLAGATLTWLGGAGSATVVGRPSTTTLTLSTPLTVSVPTPFIITYHLDPADAPYTTGSVSQSGSTVTGTLGAAFNGGMLGATITFNNTPSTARVITAVPSGTTLTVATPTQTISTTSTYAITYPFQGIQASQSGNTVTCANAAFTAGMQSGLFQFTPSGTPRRILAVDSTGMILTIDGPSATVAATSSWTVSYGAPMIVDENALKMTATSSTQAVVAYRDRNSTVYKQAFHVVDFVTASSPPTVVWPAAAATCQSVRADVSAYSGANNAGPFSMQFLASSATVIAWYPDNLAPSNRRYVLGAVTTGNGGSTPSTIALDPAQIWYTASSPSGFLRATSVAMSNDSKTAVCAMFYTDQDLDNQGNSTVSVFTIDLTQSPFALTVMPRQVWQEGNPVNAIGGCTLLAANQVVVALQRTNEDTNGYTMVADFNPSTKTFAFNPFQLFNIWATTGISVSCDPSTKRVYLFYVDGYSSDNSGHASYAAGLDSAETVYHMLDFKAVRGSAPIGVLTNTITAAGQTGVVILSGRSRVQSGLVSNSNYYGHGSGQIMQSGRALDHTYKPILLGYSESHTVMLLKQTAFG